MSGFKYVVITIFLLLSAVSVQAGAPALFADDFTTNPLTSKDWSLRGLNSPDATPSSPSLISWNSVNKNLDVTWDAAKDSSIYGVSLGRTVTDADDFRFSFTVKINSVDNPMNDYYEIAVGLDDAMTTRTRNFDRSGQSFGDSTDPRRCKNIVDWNWVPYFDTYGSTGSYVMPLVCPDPGTGGDIFRSHWGMVDTSTQLQPGHTYTVVQSYDSAARIVSLAMTDNGSTITTKDVTTTIGLQATDHFTVNRFAVKSYYNRYNWSDWRVSGSVDDVAVVVNGDAVVTEDFSSDPSAKWNYAGLSDYNIPDKSLVSYDAAGKRLEFTWNPLTNNTAFSHALAKPVDDHTSFVFEFDLELSKIAVNGDFFEVAFGLHKGNDHNFERSGKDFYDSTDPRRCKNLVDWNFVPTFDLWGGGQDSYVMSTIAPDPGTGADNLKNHWGYVDTKTSLTVGTVYHIRQTYNNLSRELKQTMTANGQPVTTDDVTYSITLKPDEHFSVDCIGPVSYRNIYPVNSGAWEVKGYIDNVRFDLPITAAQSDWSLYE